MARGNLRFGGFDVDIQGREIEVKKSNGTLIWQRKKANDDWHDDHHSMICMALDVLEQIIKYVVKDVN